MGNLRRIMVPCLLCLRRDCPHAAESWGLVAALGLIVGLLIIWVGR